MCRQWHQRYELWVISNVQFRQNLSRLLAGFTLVELLVVIAIIGILACLSASALVSVKNRARRITCLNNLRQINQGVRMYSDDSNDHSPRPSIRTSRPYSAYKELMKNYVGLKSASSAQDRLFSCPADVFYFDYVLGGPRPLVGYVGKSYCSQPHSDYSSYVFNAGNAFGLTNVVRPGIAGLSLSSIQHPARTVLVTEVTALIPFSWHKPKRPLYFLLPKNCRNCFFNDAMNMVSFVDGHVSFIKIYWRTSWPPKSAACDYDPPADYDYQWSGN